jgi:hypothetical protein
MAGISNEGGLCSITTGLLQAFLCVLCVEDFSNFGKDFNTDDREISGGQPGERLTSASSICQRKRASGEATLVANRGTRKTNGSSSGLGCSRQSVLGIPAYWRRALRSDRRFGRSLEIYDFAGPVRLFLVAGRAPHIEDLGFSLGRLPILALGCLQTAYDGRNRNGRLAMKAYHTAESWSFDLSGHFQSSQKFDSGLRGHDHPTLKRPTGSSGQIKQHVEIGGADLATH